MEMVGHRRVTLEFSVNWLFAPFVIAVALIVLFVALPEKHHPLVIFAAAVVAGAAALTTAINAVDSRISGAHQARIQAAIDAICRWNTPELHAMKAECREMVEYFKAHGAVNDQVVYLQGDSARLMHLFNLLNTYEALAVAIDANVVDEPTARRFFRSMAVLYWHTFEAWIRSHRAARNNARLYQEFEALYEKWKKD